MLSQRSSESAPKRLQARLVVRLVHAASFTTIAILLHLFKIPFPLAPFLKYDLAGVPLAVLALTSLRDSMASLPVFALGLLVLGADVVGALMKVMAETSTFIPLALVYSKSARGSGARLAVIASVAAASLSRTIFMCALNYVVTPYWLVWARWAESLESAYRMTVAIMPYVAVFNATLAIPVALLAIATYRLLARAGVLEAYKR